MKKGMINALRKVHRVNMSFEKSKDSLDGQSLVIDTEIARYKWQGVDGTFPDYEKLIPAEVNVTAHLDTVEASKAITSLKVLADSKSYPIDLHLNGGIVMSSPDDKGEVTIPADIEGGKVRVRIDGSYLTEALRACGGMVDFRITDSRSPVLFSVDGYQLVVMPMLTADNQKPEPQADNTEPESETEAETTDKAETVAEAEKVVKAEKPKRSRKKEPVAVA
jgi:DNA polymerase III sliding clamp (beta) subunit (PCNA family)